MTGTNDRIRNLGGALLATLLTIGLAWLMSTAPLPKSTDLSPYGFIGLVVTIMALSALITTAACCWVKTLLD